MGYCYECDKETTMLTLDKRVFPDMKYCGACTRVYRISDGGSVDRNGSEITYFDREGKTFWNCVEFTGKLLAENGHRIKK